MKSITLLIAVFAISLNAMAQVFDFVVAKDGTGDFATIQEAINAAPAGAARTTIFIKKGIYEEKVYIGSHTTAVNKVISLIGENRDSVIISNGDYNGIKKPYYTKADSVIYGTPQSATLTVNAPDFYMENITVRNTFISKQAVALYNLGDRHVYKNCRITGFQDTHYLKKGRRSFFYDCQIEGGTDFICAGGTAYFYKCRIKSLKGGQFVTAPEDIPSYYAALPSGKTAYYGFVFKNCDLTNDGQLSDGTVYLGRPWQATSGSIFLNCRLGNHIRPEGWSVWTSVSTNHLTSFFAEYKSMNADGSAYEDVSKRAGWSYQISDAEAKNYFTLSKVYTAGTFSTSATFDPVPFVVAPSPVTAISISGQDLSWTPADGAKGYVIYADDSAIGFSSVASYHDEKVRAAGTVYSVRTVSANGNLSLRDGQKDTVTAESIYSDVDSFPTGVCKNELSAEKYILSAGLLKFCDNTDFRIYNISGRQVMSGKNIRTVNLGYFLPSIYIVNAYNEAKGYFSFKIKI